MVEVFDMSMDVNARKLEWNFQVYVFHLWEVPNRFNEKEINGIEMVPQDVQANVIWEVVGKENPRELITSKGRETKRLVVILKDLE
ncbi:hypothetical protein AHAS_Ahas07G0160200 [Arachis hypogaea]